MYILIPTHLDLDLDYLYIQTRMDPTPSLPVEALPMQDYTVESRAHQIRPIYQMQSSSIIENILRYAARQ